MKNKYCLPIIKKAKAEVLAEIENNLGNYGYFEIWLDYIEALDQEFIRNLLDNYGGRLVFTLRRKDPISPMMDGHRLKSFIGFLSRKDCLLDLDITQVKEIEVVLSLKMRDQLILSFHDYSSTPEDTYLDKIVDKMRLFKPKILKVSTMCKEPTDALRLMKYKRDMIEKNEKHIVLGMGEHGKITRVFGALWGNELIFIPENQAESSAPGQIPRTEFDKIIKKIDNARK